MNNKIFSIFLFVFLVFVILPCTTFAFENVNDVDYYNAKYQLFDDGTAKVISMEDMQGQGVSPAYWVEYNGENYKVTRMGEKVFDNIITECNLYLYQEEAPELENNVSFDKIKNIYIKQGAIGYTTEAGWPMEKVKTYSIKTQPQDITVTAGDIKDTDILSATAEYEVGGGSIQYNWYECDENGNITNNNPVGYYVDFQIPTDLTYDNKNNTSKDYYFKCVVGSEGDILESTRVAKVTVNPGTYKVFFNAGYFAEWIPESINGSIIVPVNSEWKLEESAIPALDKLKTDKNGWEFAGWTIDEENVIDPLSIKFEKNTILYPLWKYTVTFDANDGEFDNGDSTITITSNSYSNYKLYDYIDNELPKPTKEGYEFLGYFDKRAEGTSLEYYYEESLIEEEITFYAQWKKVEAGTGVNPTPNPGNDNNNADNAGNNTSNNISNNLNTGNTSNNISEGNNSNPQTGDSIIVYVSIFIISVLGIGIIMKYKKYNN